MVILVLEALLEGLGSLLRPSFSLVALVALRYDTLPRLKLEHHFYID
jgi:hypothetical protein